MNQCLKNGARVILTQENVEAYGDLHAVSDKDGSLTLVMHYVPPLKAVIRDQDAPIGPEYDAIFDTALNFKDFNEVDCVLTLESANIMVCAPTYAFISKALDVPGTTRGRETSLGAVLEALFAARFGQESSEGETRQ